MCTPLLPVVDTASSGTVAFALLAITVTAAGGGEGGPVGKTPHSAGPHPFIGLWMSREEFLFKCSELREPSCPLQDQSSRNCLIKLASALQAHLPISVCHIRMILVSSISEGCLSTASWERGLSRNILLKFKCLP